MPKGVEHLGAAVARAVADTCENLRCRKALSTRAASARTSDLFQCENLRCRKALSTEGGRYNRPESVSCENLRCRKALSTRQRRLRRAT